MIRFIKYAFLAFIALGLVLLALANRDPVTVNVLPADLALWVGWSFAIELPLFLVIFGGVAVGLLVGFIWEWLREHRHRADARLHQRDKKKLEREVQTLKGRDSADQDDVLALIEDTSAAR